MNRGAMRTRLRQRVNDVYSTNWTDAQCDDALNAALHVICNLLAKVSPHLVRSTFAITTNGTLTSFILTAVADLHAVIELLGGPSNCGGHRISEDESDRKLGEEPSGKDTDGRWYYYLTFNSLNASAPWTLVFLKPPPAGTWSLVYNRRGVEIPTGAGAEEKQTYTPSGQSSFTITWHGVITASLAYDATSSAIKTALLNAAPPDGAGGVLTSSQVTASTGQSLVFRNSVRNLADHTAGLELMLASVGIFAPTIVGVDGDGSIYNEVPAEHADALIEAAALDLMGHDGSATAAFANQWFSNLVAILGAAEVKT